MFIIWLAPFPVTQLSVELGRPKPLCMEFEYFFNYLSLLMPANDFVNNTK